MTPFSITLTSVRKFSRCDNSIARIISWYERTMNSLYRTLYKQVQKGKLYSEHSTTGESQPQQLNWTHAASYSSLQLPFGSFANWPRAAPSRDSIPSSSYMWFLEAGTSFDYCSTEKRHNSLPSVRQHPSPFRQAGEFIRTKFWKIFEVKAKEKGRLYYFGRFCLIIDLLFTVCLGMLIINFGSRCSRRFVIQSVDGLKLIGVNFKQMTVPYRSATTLRRWGTATASVMGGLCCQTVRRQTGAKTPSHALGASVCPNEAAEQRTATYSLVMDTWQYM